jgi:hypothetical protein
MKEDVHGLIAIAHELFPRGMAQDESGYDQTPEVRRQADLRARAGASYAAFRTVLRGLEERFPGRVEDRSCGILAPTDSGQDRCFDGLLDLPLRHPGERRHSLEFLVSFVAPYYVIHSVYGVPDGTDYPMRVCSLELSADEVPYAATIAKEVEAAFPEYELMPSAVAGVVVPDVMVCPGTQARIIGCLFSDDWLRRVPNGQGVWVWASTEAPAVSAQ